ncbi:MAG: FHA domain-containing protein [Anaerolineae bacterium]|nr:FHA domain-containing protein [Anaerolineae bacterium]
MPSLTPPAAEVRACPVCGTRIREGELACSFCGHVLTQQGKTAKFDEETEVSGKKSWPTGEVLTTEQKPITFEIEGKQLTLMIAESITVGRNSDIPGDALPDVDLGPYGASEMGVSRRHIRIRRKGILLYVADLNSTNGTLLNGRKLIPEGERLIRSGDELRLGHLKIRVKF